MIDHDKTVSKFEEAIKYVLQPPENSNILIVSRNAGYLAGMMTEAAEKVGLHVEPLNLDQNAPYEHFPKELLDKIKSGDYPRGIGLFDYSKNPEWNQLERPARVEMIYGTIFNSPIGWMHSPGITEKMLEGPIDIDYQEIAREAENMLRFVKNAKKFYITAPSGTDITVEIPKGVEFDTDCVIVPPGAYGRKGVMGNLPVGEVWAEKDNELEIDGEKYSYPTKLIANGKVVCDVCTGAFDMVLGKENAVTMKFHNGNLTDISTESENVGEKLRILQDQYIERRQKYNLPAVMHELGIGLNKKARVTGNLLEDEKIGGTIHFAPGHIKMHDDFLVGDPTVKVYYEDGSSIVIMEKGKLLV